MISSGTMTTTKARKRPPQRTRQEGNIHDREYQAFLASLNFSIGAALASGPAFTTDLDPDALWRAYLRSFKPKDRKFHDCSACRRFIKCFGGLVLIGESGDTVPVVWMTGVPAEYREAFNACRKLVAKAKVSGVFLSSEKVWGLPETGCWRHMAVVPPEGATYKQVPLKTAGQAMAEIRENFANVSRALGEFPLSLCERAVEILDTHSLYRSETVNNQGRWLRDLHLARRGATSEAKRRNITWLRVAKAPNGFCHPRSSMVGTLLEDLASGMSVADAKERFAAKMDPLHYQRPQAAPTAGNIARAEKLFAELGLERALHRRFAQLHEVDALWRAHAPSDAADHVEERRSRFVAHRQVGVK